MTIKQAAIAHIIAAKRLGWHTKDLIFDYAQAALEAQGYDADNAADALEWAWRKFIEKGQPMPQDDKLEKRRKRTDPPLHRTP